MRVEKLELTNFRGIPSLSLDFPTQTTVLIGVNGVGKTAILDAVTSMLSRLVSGLREQKKDWRPFSSSDVQNGQPELRCNLTVRTPQGSPITWSAFQVAGRNSSSRQPRSESLYELVGELRRSVERDSKASLPIAIHYPTNRAVLDIPLRIRTPHVFDRFAAYDDAFTGGWSNFRLFFEWFRDQEDLENENRLADPEYRDPQLNAVRAAVESIAGFQNLRIRRQPLRMTVEKNGQELIIQQLSDGEKCLLALVADLARRLTIANPGAPRPLEGTGIVLIDEIELHLHPRWQRMIIRQLEATFPNCQFIMSTHSPQVLSEVKPDGVVLLQRDERREVVYQRAEASYGRDSNRILEDLMGVPERPSRVKEKLREYFRLIDANQLAAAQQLRQELEEVLGRDEPELVKADVLLRRKELLNREIRPQGK